jgi:hypothetical protein
MRHPLSRRESAPHSVLLVRPQCVLPARSDDGAARAYLLGRGFLGAAFATRPLLLREEDLGWKASAPSRVLPLVACRTGESVVVPRGNQMSRLRHWYPRFSAVLSDDVPAKIRSERAIESA